MHLEQCKSNETIKEMKDYAIDNGVPIINDAGLEFLLKSVFDNKPKRILEIGCAIGYSACLMSMVGGCYVDTIERD